jgi:uncharacterized protein YcaQ
MADTLTTSNPVAIPAARLRRIALESQGLLKREPFGRGPNATRRAVERLGYVQIDTISVVARAHHHVLHSRVPNYHPDHLAKLLSDGSVFEYWYHAAAYLPMRDYRFQLPRMRDMAEFKGRWIRSRDKKLMADVRRRIDQEGPLKARDFDNPKRGDTGWWNWKPAKRALEQLFMQGDLMVVSREGFEKTYELKERVLPSDTDTRMPDDEEMAAYLLRTMLRSHGFVTPKSVTHLRQGQDIRSALKTVIAQRDDEGTLVRIRMPRGDIAYADPEVLEGRAPQAPSRALLLSPFDNLVIHRDRVQSVFDFDYQIECYLKEADRRYGYFCLPLFYRHSLVGRADCKAHRAENRFEVKHLHVEAGDKHLDDGFLPATADALMRFARFNECDEVVATRTSPGRWLAPLSRLLVA